MNIVKAIEIRLEKLDRNKRWLVKNSGVGKTALYMFMQGKSDMMTYNLELTAKGLGVKLSTLIKEAESL